MQSVDDDAMVKEDSDAADETDELIESEETASDKDVSEQEAVADDEEEFPEMSEEVLAAVPEPEGLAGDPGHSGAGRGRVEGHAGRPRTRAGLSVGPLAQRTSLDRGAQRGQKRGLGAVELAARVPDQEDVDRRRRLVRRQAPQQAVAHVALNDMDRQRAEPQGEIGPRPFPQRLELVQLHQDRRGH